MGIAVWEIKSQYETYADQEVFDCLLAEYVLSEGRYPLKLPDTLEHYGVATIDELATKQRYALEQHPQLHALFHDVEMPLAKVLWQMERNGISLDQLSLTNLGQEITKRTTACVAEIQKLLKANINLSSPSQVGNILVAQFKVPLPKTPSGQYATGEQVLQQFQNDFPIIQHILQYRELTKLQNTYVTGLLKKVGPDGKIHTTYNQSAVITGRLSSSNPNLQNIPATSDLGKQIKACFVAPPQRTLVAFDYSQQELRILAHMSQDKTLIDAFNQGKDIHKVTASQIFKVSYDEVTQKQRSAAKTINFGIVYGMGSFGLSQQLKISVEEASTFIDQFYTTFPGIKQFFDQLLTQGRKQNYITTILGRRRFVFQEGARSFIDHNVRRELINFPIQGSAADFIKKSMVQINQHVLTKQENIAMLLQIHDELVFEMDQANQETMHKTILDIHKIMSTIYQLAVPMDVDIKIGERWGNMQPYSLQ
jgi:DNA polymerase I